MKYFFTITNWAFASIKNQLAVSLFSTSNSSDQQISTQSDGSDNLQWLKVKDACYSLYLLVSILLVGLIIVIYAQFLEVAVLDDKIQNVKFEYIKGTARVDVFIPHFWEYAGINISFLRMTEY